MHGGTVNDLAIHGIDLVRMLTGEEITHIDAARTWNAYAYKHKSFKDCAVFMARTQSGASVLADVSYSAPSQVFSMPTYWEFTFWCEKGMLRFSYAKNSVTVFKEGVKEPLCFKGDNTERDYLDEFVFEIRENKNEATENVILSSSAALRIQSFADKEVSQ